MGLSAAEQVELAQLEKQYGQQSSQPVQSGLTPEEQAELAALEKTHGAQQQPQEKPGYLTQGIDMIPGMKERRENIAAYRQANPDPNYRKPVTGLEDPVYSTGVGLTGEAPIWALAKSIPKGVGALRDFLAPAAKRSEVLSKVKNVEQLEPYVAQHLNDAKEMFNKKQIAPRMLEQQSRASEQMVPIHPEQLKGLHPEVDEILEKAQQAVSSQPYGAEAASHVGGEYNPSFSKPEPKKSLFDYDNFQPASTESKYPEIPQRTFSAEPTSNPKGPLNQPVTEPTGYTPQPAEPKPSQSFEPQSSQADPRSRSGSYSSPAQPGEINLPMKDVLEIRRKLNSVTPSFADPTARTKQLNAGNYIRSQLGKVDPNIGQLSEELNQAYNTQKAAVGTGKNPINSVLTNDGAAGLAKKSRLKSFDQQAGSDLTGLGQNIKTANDRLRPTSLSDLFSIHGLKHVATKVISPASRSYDALAEKVTPTLEQLLKDPESIKSFGLKDASRAITRPGDQK